MKKHYYLLFTILIASLSFGQIASDDFTYSDGSLVGNGAWVNHSGTAGDLLVSSGQAVVQHGTPSEDANLPFTPVSGNLYYGIDFSVSSSSDIPGTDNEYFAHFKDDGYGFRGRLDVVPGTGGGNYTVGISSQSGSSDAIWGTDLTFDVTYRAIVGYDQDTGIATLWIDASSSGDTSITGDTPSSGTSIESFALRQSDSNNNETITVDNLIVAQTFAEVSGAASAESLPWSDSFETAELSSWTLVSDAGDDQNIWQISSTDSSQGSIPSAASDGSEMMSYDDYNTSSGLSATITSPELDLTSATAPQLTFDYYDYGGGDTVEVLVNGAVAYTTGSSTSGWEAITVDLTSYVGANATIGFKGTSEYGYSNPHVDNVMVAEAPTAASADWDVSAANFSDSATVSVTVDNFTVTTDGSGDGHWHYTLDGGSEVMVYDTNDVTLTSLSTGDHTLVAWLVDNAHADLDPAVTETITWTQTNAPGCGDDPYDHYYGNGSSGGYSFATNFTAPDAAELLFTTSVDNAGDTMTIVLSGYTEENYDWVYITDGAGNVLLTPVSGDLNDTVTATDGTINVYLASDSSITVGPTTFTITCETPITYESIPWHEDFETGDLSNWTSSEAAGAPTSIWEASDLANTTSGGGYSARHNYSSSGTYDSYLVGPTFDLSGAANPEVNYSDYVDWTSDADTHSLVYSEDYVDDVDAATWVVLNDVLGTEDTWVANGPYALPATGTVTIAFRYQGYYAAEWFVDEITVAEDTWSVDDVDPLDMRIYPNPVDGNFVTILSPVNGTKYIQVFDINGRRVMDTSINNNTLDVSSINSGFYMIKVTIDGQSKISKLIVR